MIAFVYFDLGGVVIRDFSGTNKWEELKKELGIIPEKAQEFEDFWIKYEPEVCVGKRSIDSLLPLIKKQFGSNHPDNYSLLIDGFVNHFEKNPHIWFVIDEIRKHYKLGLLTNMYPGMLDEIRKKELIIENKWDVVIDSSIVGLQKPDPKIFELAEKKAGSYGNKILFVENSLGHVNAASDFGWQTFLYDSKDPEKSSRDLSKFVSSIQY